MAAVHTSSVNVFALLDSDDPGDTRVADLAAQAAKADTAAKKRSRKFHRRWEPEMSLWKKNKLKAEAEAAAKKKVQQQLATLSTKTNAAGRIRRPQQPAVPSRAPVVGTASIGKNIQGAGQKPPQAAVPSKAPVSAAAVNMKPKLPAAASTARANTTANAGDDEQFLQQPATPARGNLFDQLFAYANSVRAFIYGSGKQNGPANAKNGVAGDAPTDDKKGGRRLA